MIITRSAPFIMASDPALTPVASATVLYVRKNGLADYGGDESLLLAGKMVAATAMLITLIWLTISRTRLPA
ncbi:hypothetical protein [Pantoea sp. App145]|uniref:hypothetical protein n=1 Tax=Pantoea sp. App145 TaxID=3071567 RepID=UPI003A7FE39C